MILSSTASPSCSAFHAVRSDGAEAAGEAAGAASGQEAGSSTPGGSASPADGLQKPSGPAFSALPANGDLHPAVRDRVQASSPEGPQAGAPAATAAEISDEELAARQAIITDALTHGRREETIVYSGEVVFRSFKEYLPGGGSYPDMGGDMPVFGRVGQDIVKPNGEIDRTTTYLNRNDPGNPGWVKSVIKDGIETIVAVHPGGVGIDFQAGDQRPAPARVSTKAGLLPQTPDPKRDGSWGTSNSPNTAPPGSAPASDTPTGFQAGPARDDVGFGPHPSDPPSDGPGDGAPVRADDGTKGADDTGTKGTEGQTGTEGNDGTEGPAGSGNDAPGAGTAERPEPGGTPPAGDDSACHDKVNTSHKDNANDENEQWKEGTAMTCTPPTTVEVEADDSDDSGYRAAPGDGADVGSGGAWSLGLRPAPADAGNPADENAVQAPSGERRGGRGADPWTTDPGRGEGGDEAITAGPIGLGQQASPQDFGNPADPHAVQSPAGEPRGTGDAERIAGRDA